MERGRTKERTTNRGHRKMTPDDWNQWFWKGYPSHYVCQTCMRGYKYYSGFENENKFCCGVCKSKLLYVGWEFKLPSRKTKEGKKEWKYVQTINPEENYYSRKDKLKINFYDYNDQKRLLFTSIKEML